MVDESISGFLEIVAKHPALTNNKDAIEPGHKEQCSELYIQLLEKVFDSFDKIPNSIKENIPGYDRRIFEEVKLLQIKLKQTLAKSGRVSAQGSPSVTDTDNGDNANESGLDSNKLHSLNIQKGAHHSGTSTSAPRSSTPQGPRNDLLLISKYLSSLDAFQPLNNGSYSLPPKSKSNKNVAPCTAERIRNAPEIPTQRDGTFDRWKPLTPPKVTEWLVKKRSRQVHAMVGKYISMPNKDIPSSTAERIINTSERLKPLTATEAPTCAPVAQSFARFQRPQLSKDSLQNNNRLSTDSVKENKDSKPMDDCDARINMGNDANVSPAAEVSNNSVSGTSSSNVEEGNRLFSIPCDEFGWQKYREEDFEMGNRNLSEQIIRQERGNNYLIKKPPSVTIDSNKELPPSSARMRSALERARAAQIYTRFQSPQLSKKSLQNNNRPSTNSLKENKDSNPMDDCDVPIYVGNDTNITPEAAEVSNNGVSGASSSNVEEGNRLFSIPFDEFGWQKYREEDFEMGNRNLSEQIIRQERGNNYLIKKPPSVTIDSNKELPPSSARMRSALERARAAQIYTRFQSPQLSKNSLQNNNRPRTDSLTENKDCKPMDDCVLLINTGNDTNVTPEAAKVSNNCVSDASSSNAEEGNISRSIKEGKEIIDALADECGKAVLESANVKDSVASTSNADLVNSALDIHVDEDGWQVYRPEDFEENIEDIGNQEPQVVDVMKNSGDTDHHASIQNNGITGEFDGLDYPHSAHMLHMFYERFGLTSFRPNQLQVINAMLLGNDCFVLMPTGGGKSLCYQLPAILTPGVTIVISPLKSLILDQVNKLLSLHIPAAHLSGDLPQSTCDEIYHKLSLFDPALKLLYVTPEKISSSNQLKSVLSELYSRDKLARFVIDEAHCVSQWGHDFRPDYKRLSVLRAQFPKTSIVALTATATPRVRKDILHQLQVSTCKWFLSSFNRPNLAYRILDKNPRSINQDVVTVIKEQFAGLSGIVYCLSRRECEKLSADLRVAGVHAEFYHGGRSDTKRWEVQARWAAGTYKVICATIAFGMGVDKADVRYVIHHSMPKSVEGYYQEAGRAGRDGDTAICLLYYSYSDFTRYSRMINTDRKGTPETVRMHMKNLRSMMEVCESETECRREQVLAYLGERYERADCKRDCHTACDNCLNEDYTEHQDMTEDCKLIVRCIRESSSGLHASFTLLHVADALRGSMQARLQPLQNTPLHGLLMSWTRTDVMRLLRQMLVRRFLTDDVIVNDNNPNTYVSAGSNADKLLSGEQRILFTVKEQPAPAGCGDCAGDEACDGPTSKRARIDPALSNNASNPRPGTSPSGETHQAPN